MSAAVNDPEPLEESEKVRLVLPVTSAMFILLDENTLIVVSAAVKFPEIFEELEIFMLVLPAVKSASSSLDPERLISRSLLDTKPVALPSQEFATANVDIQCPVGIDAGMTGRL